MKRASVECRQSLDVIGAKNTKKEVNLFGLSGPAVGGAVAKPKSSVNRKIRPSYRTSFSHSCFSISQSIG